MLPRQPGDDDQADKSPSEMMALALLGLGTTGLGALLGHTRGDAGEGALQGLQAGASAGSSVFQHAAKADEEKKKADAAAAKYSKEREDRVEDAVKIDKLKGENKPAKLPDLQSGASPILERQPDGSLKQVYTPPDKPAKDISVTERNTLQTQYDRDPEVRKNKQVFDSYDSMKALLKDKSPASDQALVYSYMKALDPGSVVRETEAESAQALGGLMERAKAKLSQMSGTGSLTDAQRADLANQIRKLAASARNRQQAIDGQFAGLATKRGVDTSDLRFALPPTDEGDEPSPLARHGDSVVTPEEAAAELERRKKAKSGS